MTRWNDTLSPIDSFTRIDWSYFTSDRKYFMITVRMNYNKCVRCNLIPNMIFCVCIATIEIVWKSSKMTNLHVLIHSFCLVWVFCVCRFVRARINRLDWWWFLWIVHNASLSHCHVSHLKVIADVESSVILSHSPNRASNELGWGRWKRYLWRWCDILLINSYYMC